GGALPCLQIVYWAALRRSGGWIASRQASHGTSPGWTVNQSRSGSAMAALAIHLRNLTVARAPNTG
ncbi:MAG: hypothetical protein ACLQB1_30400, partial [Streptosporangiaceae bacterium]